MLPRAVRERGRRCHEARLPTRTIAQRTGASRACLAVEPGMSFGMIRPLLLIAAALLALAAAGCGADDTGGDDPLAALETAARKTGDAESFRQRFAMRSDLGG
jgi:hypothetical protein